MARDFRHGLKSDKKFVKPKRVRDEREDKLPSKQYYAAQLRRAVQAQDYDAFEDYDEPETRKN